MAAVATRAARCWLPFGSSSASRCRPGEQSGAQAREDPSGQQHGDVLGEHEEQGTRAGQQERGEQDRTAPEVVRDTAKHEQGGQHTQGVDGKNHANQDRGKLVLLLVEDVEWRRQGGPEHAIGEHAGEQQVGQRPGDVRWQRMVAPGHACIEMAGAR